MKQFIAVLSGEYTPSIAEIYIDFVVVVVVTQDAEKHKCLKATRAKTTTKPRRTQLEDLENRRTGKMAKQDGPGPEKTKREEARRRRKTPTRTTTTELNSRTK